MKKNYLLLVVLCFILVRCVDDGPTDFAIQPEDDSPIVENPITKVQALDGNKWIDGMIDGKAISFAFRFLEKNDWGKVSVKFEVDENTSMIDPDVSPATLDLSGECIIQANDGYRPVEYIVKASEFAFITKIKVTIDEEVNESIPEDKAINMSFIGGNVSSSKVEITLNDGIVMVSPSNAISTQDLSSPLEIKVKDSTTEKVKSYMLSVQSDWTDITSALNTDGVLLPSYMTVYENTKLHDRDGNKGYVIKIKTGSVNMETSYNEMPEQTWFNNNQNVADVVKGNTDYNIFVGGVGLRYWKPMTRPTVVNSGQVLRHSNLFWNIEYYTSPPTLAVKGGKASIAYADVVGDALYKFPIPQNGVNKSLFVGGERWDVDAAVSGYAYPLQNGNVQIGNESPIEYKVLADKERNHNFSTIKNGMETTSVKINVGGTDKNLAAHLSDAERMARTVIGVTSGGDVMIFVSERYSAVNNLLIDEVNYPSDGSTLREAAVVLKELGCSDALVLHQVNFAVTVLQDKNLGKDMTKTYNRSDGRDLKNSTLIMFK